MNTVKLTEPVGTTARTYYAKTEVSKGMEVDFGNRTLEQITLKMTLSSQEFNKWKLDSMIDYIINTHHGYAKANAVMIYELAQKVAYHHSKNHPELTKLTTAMFLFLHDLLNCMMKEEQILFPNIKQLIKDKSYSGESGYTTFGLIKEWVNLVQREHQASVKYLRLFQELTNDYTLPEDACTSYKCLFEKMKEFEDDLLMHVHIESNILFPKALAEDEEFDENAFVHTKR